MWLWNRIFVILVVLQTYGILTEDIGHIDVFMPGLPGGKPTLGSSRTTCWARGGICIDIRYCTTMQFDTSVAGCTRGYKVCCKVYKFGSPTVGTHRKSSDILVFSSSLRELDQASIQLLAMKNTNKLQL